MWWFTFQGAPKISVVVWITMAPLGSYTWMLSHQGVEMFEKIRRIGGMVLLEEVYTCGCALRFQKPTPGWGYLSLFTKWRSGCKLSSFSNTVLAFMFPTKMIRDYNPLKLKASLQLNTFLYKSFLGHSVFYTNGTVTKTTRHMQRQRAYHRL